MRIICVIILKGGKRDGNLHLLLEGLSSRRGYFLEGGIRMFFKKSMTVGGLPFDGRVSLRDNAASAAVESMQAKM